MTLKTYKADGLLFIGDPHLADTPPGQRTDGYLAQIMDKLEACLEEARSRNLIPVFLGDLFHWPRDNSNHMLVSLMRLMGSFTEPCKPWVLVGNHDKYQARFTDDVTMAVLREAGVINLMDDKGPQFQVDVEGHTALVCASPDGTRIPKQFDRSDHDVDTVLWLTHHNIQFPEFEDRAHSIREIQGVDMLINGHIHRPQETIRKGQTTWCNPGNITRLTFTRRSMKREPAAAIWTPGCEDLEKWVIPHLHFSEIFPDQELPPEKQEVEGESLFIQGLERLAFKKTREGEGLKQFLEQNLDKKSPESKLIWSLYEEVVHDESQ